MSKAQIVANRVQCLVCSDIIESRHRHDFVTCACGSTSLDGGKDYQRVLGTNWKDASVTSEDHFELQREVFTWKSYGVTGADEPRIIPLSQLTSSHIKAILETQFHIKGTWVADLLKKELEFRKTV